MTTATKPWRKSDSYKRAVALLGEDYRERISVQSVRFGLFSAPRVREEEKRERVKQLRSVVQTLKAVYVEHPGKSEEMVRTLLSMQRLQRDDMFGLIAFGAGMALYAPSRCKLDPLDLIKKMERQSLAAADLEVLLRCNDKGLANVIRGIQSGQARSWTNHYWINVLDNDTYDAIRAEYGTALRR